MLLTLFDSEGNKKLEFSPADSSTQVKEIQADNVLSLSFTTFEYAVFGVNDYVDFYGERYWALEQYVPNQKADREWKYDVRMYGLESLIKRYLVLDGTDGENNPEFTLTGPASQHMELIVRCINSGMGTDVWKVGDVVKTGNLVIDYSGTYCDEGLKLVAEAAGTEYWFDGTTVNLCRCERGEEITLGYGNGVTSITPTTASNAKFYTRLFPLGSTRNIDPSKYGHRRLQLPGGAKYIDVNVEKYGIIHHYEESAFSGIYPRRVGTISSVRSKEVTDGSGNPYTIYYFTDSGLDFNPDDYMLAGEVLRVSFQEGSELAGLGTGDDHYFEVNWHEDDGEFEIITIWPDGTDIQLPGGLLVPKAGDKYILWNMGMPGEYYTAAEQELAAAVDAYNKEHGIDLTVFKCPTDHVWIEDNKISLDLGQRVRLESSRYFDEGYRSSRITKITRKVNLPAYMDLEIGDALSRSAMTRISDNIRDMKVYARELVERGGIDVLKTGDGTTPSDYNVFSALRALRTLLRKDIQDTLPYGVKGANYISGMSGWSIDANGNAEFESAVIRSFLQVTELLINRLQAQEGDTVFSDNDQIEKVEEGTDETDGSTYYILTLKEKWKGYFTAQQYGNIIVGIINTLAASAAGIGDVSDGDCVETDGANKYYTSFMRVIADRNTDTGLGKNQIKVVLYGDTDVPAQRNFPPCELMNIARWGCVDYADPDDPDYEAVKASIEKRQRLFYISASDGRIMKLTGVNKPMLEQWNYGTTLGTVPDFVKDWAIASRLMDGRDYLYAQGIIVGDYIKVDIEGRPIVTYYDEGEWENGKTYYKDEYNADRLQWETSDVWHNGCKWRCLQHQPVVIGGVETWFEPKWNSSYWQMIEGNDNLSIEFASSNGYQFRQGAVDTVVMPHLFYGNTDISGDIDSEYWNWERSSDKGTTAADETWNARHKGVRAITLTNDDMPVAWSRSNRAVFTCKVTLNDGKATQIVQNQIIA